MNNESILKIAGQTLDQGRNFNNKITRSTDQELIDFAIKIEMKTRESVANWLRNNYQDAGNIASICEKIEERGND